MGRKKLAMKRIENSKFRQIAYAKRKDGIVKKTNELSILCDTDVALIMFSPTGCLTTFPSNGRVEDTFLRFVDRPDEQRGGPIRNEEYLSRRLKQLKVEREILERVAKYFYPSSISPSLCMSVLDLADKLDKLNRQHHDAQEKMRLYGPNVKEVNSVHEAELYQQSLMAAIERVQLSKAKLLGNRQRSNNIEAGKVNMEDSAFITDHSADVNQNGSSIGVENRAGPHLSLSLIQSQKQWKALGGEMTPNSAG
ncbi:agamous-like MADS-box AGL66 [Olea europaea subsp. europaea]|uniref:Agamous-like MADS-box AGL66 n=1 Tax=Olea europaea subsp. europaea TaxID=158383 RepID=A0A8S0SRJ9_OLEEU|nr:agamous-like MADS-box AGL66 [Olea europaea subsp. europaea]